MPIAQKKRQPRRELVDVEAGVEAGADVLHTVGQRVGELEVGRRPGLLDVVAGDRDRVEPRHLLRGEGEDVGDDPHARRRRVDVGVADHELLEDVVLDGPRELLRLHPLLLGRGDVEREHRQHGAVHGHRDRHLVERDAVEEGAGVVDRVDRDTGHADVAAHARVVGVVAAVGRQVEGDREALLAGREVAAVERVGLLGGGEAGVLPDRPRLGGVHRRVRARAGTGSGPARCRARRGPRGARGRRREDVDALGAGPRARRRSRRSRREPRASLACRSERRRLGEVAVGMLMRASPSSGSGTPGRPRPSRRSRRLPVDRLAGDDHVRGAGGAQRRDEGGAPLGVRRVGAGQADDLLRRRRQPARPRRRRWDRPTSTATPPAANRLVANVARAVCAATVPMRGQEDRRGGRLVAQRLEGGAVAADVLGRSRSGARSGSVLAEVRELADPGQRLPAEGDLLVAGGGDLVDAARRGRRRRPVPRRPRSGGARPSRRRRGRR